MKAFLKQCSPMRIAIGALAIALSLPAIAFTNQQGQGWGPFDNTNQNVRDERSDDDDDDDKDRKKDKNKKKLEREQDKRDKKQQEDRESSERRSDDDDDDDKDKDDKKQKDSDKDDDDDDDDRDKDDDDDEDDDRNKDDDDDDDDDKDKDDDDDEDDDKDKNKDDDDDDKVSSNSLATIANARSEASSPMPAESSSLVAALGVTATIETAPVPSAGDAADDPAIWINPKDPSQSTIIGSNKQGGLAVYSLDGNQLQYLPDGLMNNVDIRAGFPLGGQEVSIVAAGNRGDNSMALYRVNPSTRMLENVAARKIITIPAYGSCLYRSQKTGKFYYIVTSKSGEVEQWELSDKGGKVDAKSVRRFKVGTQLEGCVADDELGHLYIGEEAVGIWKYGAEVESGEKRVLVDAAGPTGHLVADVEGLTIAYGKDGTGYLIASSQGNNSYVVYKREMNNAYVKTFTITAGSDIDGVEDTDGIDVTMANLGPAFPQGLFVAQDGINDKGNQNFKLVSLQSILSVR